MELLQRATPMSVVQVSDRMVVRPDHVYVIPPNRDLALENGSLRLVEPLEARGVRLPIDFFFRSLAAERKEHGIGVILSGMGCDGTLGLRAIKENAGAVFVQAPGSAKFDSMPRSAIDAGLADVVAPAAELPGRIVEYLQQVVSLSRSDQPPTGEMSKALETILRLLQALTGHDFSSYKPSTLHRRIERRMGLHKLPRVLDYVRYLRANPEEGELLFRELLIGVTSFFRDPEVWEQVRTEVVPALLAARPNGGQLRAWVPACSTGEEAYSLAMVFTEALEQARPPRSISLQIFATDLDQDAIEKARSGLYPPNIVADVSPERLGRFFLEEEGHYRVGKEIREQVIFAPQNLAMDPPFTRLDFLSCRNLLIYLDTSLQKRLLPLFHYSMLPGGFLVLGKAETIGTATELFAPLAGKTRIFRRLDRARSMGVMDLPAVYRRPSDAPAVPPGSDRLPRPAPDLSALVNRVLLQHHAPAAVLVTDKGDIVHVHGKTGKYLEPAAGKANLNLFSMAREGLRSLLLEAFRRASQTQTIVTLDALPVGTNGGTAVVSIVLQPLAEPAALKGMTLVVFTDEPASASRAARGRSQRVSDSAASIQALELELQRTRSSMQASQEELQSINEELQSTNEELQSTNEELTTSKEEMQSMNEELQTVNHELQAKLNELEQTSSDMHNLLNSTEIAALFLDERLRVRRFTPATVGIFNLLPGDAGRPITDLNTELEYPGLGSDVHEVLRTLAFRESVVSTRDDRWFRVRIMPYRSLQNRIDGVVITFLDISAAKRQERNANASEARLRTLLEKRGEGGAES